MKLVTLKKNKEFGYVYRRGMTAPVKNFTMIVVKSKYGGVRAGFSVSKKVGNAVVRNRARRRLKEAFQRVLPSICGNYSLIFVARPCVSEAEFSGIVRDMRSALRKARVVV